MPLIALGHTRISTLRGMRNVDFSGKSEMQCSACNFAAGHMARKCTNSCRTPAMAGCRLDTLRRGLSVKREIAGIVSGGLTGRKLGALVKRQKRHRSLTARVAIFVRAGPRQDEVPRILERHGAHDIIEPALG